jgi:hypothetical protein
MIVLLAVISTCFAQCFVPSINTCVQLLNTSTIPKFVTNITAPPVFVPDTAVGPNNYTVWMSAFLEQILPVGFSATPVWGYEGRARASNGVESFTRSSPGADDV